MDSRVMQIAEQGAFKGSAEAIIQAMEKIDPATVRLAGDTYAAVVERLDGSRYRFSHALVAEIIGIWHASGDRNALGGRRTPRDARLDIFAARGTPVGSTTRGVVSAVRESGLGGRQVWVLGPALERHYYAHLDDWREGLAVGDVVLPGDVLGYVGDTGNARGTPPHLHYGIYADGGALDPLPRLRTAAVDPPGTAPAR